VMEAAGPRSPAAFVGFLRYVIDSKIVSGAVLFPARWLSDRFQEVFRESLWLNHRFQGVFRECAVPPGGVPGRTGRWLPFCMGSRLSHFPLPNLNLIVILNGLWC
jgi:hypothetical protein